MGIETSIASHLKNLNTCFVGIRFLSYCAHILCLLFHISRFSQSRMKGRERWMVAYPGFSVIWKPKVKKATSTLSDWIHRIDSVSFFVVFEWTVCWLVELQTGWHGPFDVVVIINSLFFPSFIIFNLHNRTSNWPVRLKYFFFLASNLPNPYDDKVLTIGFEGWEKWPQHTLPSTFFFSLSLRSLSPPCRVVNHPNTPC